ncbi:hypothetical protein C6Y14_34155 [Streptomyces dioscori]|uniref:Uncharacterized protein n=1 Tax=Streptomyces dioscori TaxID=2109333 RepID=A0A2P8PYJ5_9ACTN|nr:hypothetical protein [Streptomyces dioscori]PSM39061.1 hypothetical protein C6Y14_34155 [Streptomyces dioscori]
MITESSRTHSCHVGGFTPGPDEHIKGRPVYACPADECDYTVARADLVHGPHHRQSLTMAAWHL